jgi:hypothetical protein
MLTTAPRWVKNGDGASATVSGTYYSQETLRAEVVARGQLPPASRSKPKSIGESDLRDGAKVRAFRTQLGS